MSDFFKVLVATLAFMSGCLSLMAQPKDSTQVRELEASDVRGMEIDPFAEEGSQSFPARRSDNWALGLNLGMPLVGGEVKSTPGYGGGLYLQKSLGHTVALRLQGIMGRSFGQDWEPTQAGATVSYRNFRASFTDISIQAVVSSNNINFFRSQVGAIVYGFGGLGVLMHKVEQNLVNANGQAYDYAAITAPTSRSDRSRVLDALGSIQDDSYETALLPDPLNADINENYLNPSLILGAGMGFRLSRRVDLNLEYRVSWHNTDMIDGYATSRSSNPTAFNDVLHYPNVSLALKLGKGTESRWWANPLATQYDNIRQLNQVAKDTRKDEDGDGVLDFLDQEPGTGFGATVNTHGVTVENQDELLLKVTEELGKLAENVSDLARQNDQKIEQLRTQMETAGAAGMPVTIHFAYNQAEITNAFYPDLQRVAEFMKQNPSLRVRVSGYTDTRADEPYNDRLAARRVDAAVKALTSYFMIAPDRLEKEIIGEKESLVPNLPDDKFPKNDGPHYLNRRVVFSVIQ